MSSHSIIAKQVNKAFNTNRLSIVEFSESEEFCGKPLYPRQRVLLKLWFLEEMDGWEEDILSEWIRGSDGEVSISPYVRERRDWLRERGYSHFPEVINVGGRRSSKGYITAIALTKLLYDTQQLGDPGAHYSIDPDKEIYFTCVAASLDQAKKYQFADFVSTAARCQPLLPFIPKFQEESFSIHTDSDRRLVSFLKSKGLKVNRDWAKLRAIPLAANADTIRGSASMGVVFDEVAFMLPGESRSSAEQCYQAAKPALDQFGRAGMIFLNSSPYTKIGLFYERWCLAMNKDRDGVDMDDGGPRFPTMLAVQYPSWELYRDYDKDPRRRFTNAVMVSPDWDTEALNDDDKAKHQAARLEEEGNPDTFRVERRGHWQEVLDAYLNPEMVNRAFRPTFAGREIKMTSGGTYVYDYKGHVDPSSTTAGFGMALAHVEEFADEENPETMVKHVVFDVVKRWDPREFPGRTIDYMRVQSEIADYIQLYYPYEWTFDQFNSVAPIQWLRQELSRRRINCRVYEKTATKKLNWDRWETFKTALNLGLIHLPPDCPDSDYAMLELKFLQEINGKVEKQSQGPVVTKDIADCIAEVSVSLIGHVIQNYMVSNTSDSYAIFGSQGGFQIGGRSQYGPASFQDFYHDKKNNAGMNSTRGIKRAYRDNRW